MNRKKKEKIMQFDKIFMLLISASLLTTPAFAILATDIFASGVNTEVNNIKNTNDIGGQGGEVWGERDNELIGGTIGNIDCINGVNNVPCTITGTPRILAPYTDIDANWPTAAEFAAADNITVGLNGALTITPGVYNVISVAGSNVNNRGVLTMEPGIYYINEYLIKGQIVPGDNGGTDPEGTVISLIKSELDFTGSYNNCQINGGDGIPLYGPNRYIFYTEDIEAQVSSACVSGYMYFKYSLKQAQMDLWGAISAQYVTLQNGAHIYVDTGSLLFADFRPFLEIGPQQSAGWHIVGAPAEINATNPVTVGDFFGNDFNTSTFRTDWRVYQRDYNDTDHSVYYTELANLADNLEKSRGYWIGAKKDANMTVLGLKPVVWEYDIPGCTSVDGCYRYTLKSCSVGDTDPYYYNLVGYPGAAKADWADYRVQVEGNVTIMTPSQAHAANILNKQIWYYDSNGSTNQVLSGEYGTCDDSGSLPCNRPDYFQGHWVEVNCTNSLDKNISLIIPNGM